MKPVDWTWYTHGNKVQVVGAVLCLDAIIGKYIAYIGVGEGESEEADIKSIMNWGQKIPKDTAEGIFGLSIVNYDI